MPNAKIAIFSDTNVLFSAFYGSPNNERILQAHILDKIKLVISQKVLEELVRNVRRKEPQALNIVEKFLQTTPPKIVKNPGSISPGVKKLVHPKDQIIFQSAVNAKVKYFVTGNTKDYNARALLKKYKIAVLTPSQTVQKLSL